MLPTMHLDEETYQEILQDSKSMIQHIFPDWTDYNEHDPGITLLQLFSWLKEMQLYHMDQIQEKNYLKYLNLLGMKLQGKQCSKTLLHFYDMKDEVTIKAGTPFGAANIGFEVSETCLITPGMILKIGYETDQDTNTMDYEGIATSGRLSFPIFGQYPKVGNKFLLGLTHNLRPHTRYQIYVKLNQEEMGRRNAISQDFVELGTLKLEYATVNGWEEAAVEVDETHCFLESGFIYFSLENPPDTSQGLWWLRFTLTACEYDTVPLLGGITMNYGKAIQCETLAKYRIVPIRAYRQWANYVDITDQEINFLKTPQGYEVVSLEEKAELLRKGEAGELLEVYYEQGFADQACLGVGTGFPNQEMECKTKQLLQSITLLVEEKEGEGRYQIWEQVEDFDASAPEDLHYTFNENTGLVTFGNCYHGLAPKGKVFLISCKATLDGNGNVKERKINRVLSSEFESRLKVENLENSNGGAPAETIEKCFLRYHTEKSDLTRAVTLSDFETVVLRTPGLCFRQVKAIDTKQMPRVDGSYEENLIAVAVQPGGNQGTKLPKSIKENIRRHVEKYRIVGNKVTIVEPEYIYLTIYVELGVKAYYGNVEHLVRQELIQYFNREQSTFGASVMYSKVYGSLDMLPYTKEVISLTMDAVGRGIRRTKNGDILIPPHGLVILKDIHTILSSQ